MLNSFDTSKISAKPLTKVLTSSPSVPSPEGPGQGKIKPLMTNSPGIEMEGLEPSKSYPSEFLRDIRFASSDTARPTPEVRKMAANNSSFSSYDLEPYISEGRSTTQDSPSSLAGDFNSEPGDFYTDYDSDSDCSSDDYQYEDCMDEKISFYGTPVSCIGEFVPGDLTQAVTSGPPISTPDKSFDTPKDTRPNFKEQIRYLKSSVIPWGKFKGYYDTRSLVCAHKVYHAKRLTKCKHCAHASIVPSPLKREIDFLGVYSGDNGLAHCFFPLFKGHLNFHRSFSNNENEDDHNAPSDATSFNGIEIEASRPLSASSSASGLSKMRLSTRFKPLKFGFTNKSSAESFSGVEEMKDLECTSMAENGDDGSSPVSSLSESGSLKTRTSRRSSFMKLKKSFKSQTLQSQLPVESTSAPENQLFPDRLVALETEDLGF